MNKYVSTNNNNEIKKNVYKIISILCILISISVWIINFALPKPTTLTLLTFYVSPLGFVMALIILIKYNCKQGILLAILNLIMFFSLFIIMGIGYTLYDF